MKIISFFNHKGGVGKTTLTYNVGWALKQQNKKVLLIDADPQCNLTEFVLGQEDSEFNENIYSFLMPYIQPEPGKGLPEINHLKQKDTNLEILPGSIQFAELESRISLSIAGIPGLQNIPTAFYNAIREIGKDFDYVLFDMSPSLSATNQLILMISDYFLTPVNPSIFSIQAIKNLSTIYRGWNRDLSKFDFWDQKKLPQYLGMVFQNYRPYSRKGEENTTSAKRFEERAKELNECANNLAKDLNGFDMAISKEVFEASFEHSSPFEIAKIPDYNQLAVCAEKENLPVIALDNKILQKYKLATPQYIEKLEDFQLTSNYIAEGLIKLSK